MSHDAVPIPDYEVQQYFPSHEETTADERRQLRERYGRRRAWFKLHPDGFRDLQRWLNQSHTGTTYDRWMTDSVTYAAVAGLGGFSLGVLLTLFLAEAGVFAGAQNPVPTTTSLTPYLVALAPYKTVLVGSVLTLSTTALFAGSVLAIRYTQPLTRARLRARHIDVVLPHAIVYMYALSHGGMNFIEVVRSLGDEADYGEVAAEFDRVGRDMELFGSDLHTALRNARNVTPSENLEEFLDDLISLLDSGGDVPSFLYNQSETYLAESAEDQESFLETLSLLSELFIAGFVAAPLLLIVTLIVISFLGGDTLTQLYALTYLVFPLGMALYILLVDQLGQPFDQDLHAPKPESTAAEELRQVLVDAVAHLRRSAAGALADLTEPFGFGRRPTATDGGHVDVRFEQYRRHNAFGALLRLVRDPVTLMRRQASLTTLVTVPLALCLLGVVLATDIATPSVGAMRTDPVWTTFWLVLAPAGVVAVPLSLFHELERRRRNTVEQRFPDALNVLASANQMGIPLVDGLALVSRWSAGTLGTELRTLRNDIAWNGDVAGALTDFADRLAVPSLGRVVRLVAQGGQASGDLSRILSVAAADTRSRYKLDRARQRAMSTYIAIVVIGFAVFLFVIVMLSASYLAPLQSLPGAGDQSASALPMGIGGVPVDSYRALFFHSAVLQALGSGLLAGKLSDNDALTGLKYSIGLTVLALVAFLVI